MRDDQKTKAKLLRELNALRSRVTELTQAQEKLKQYRFIVEAVHDAIFFKDLESRYIIANNKTLEAFGLSREQVIGKNDYEIMANQDEARKNIEDDNLVFKTGKLTDITKRMTGADGKERWFQAVKVPRFDDEGKIIGLVGIARDITERKRAEEEIRASEEKFRGLAERSFDIIFMTDAQGYLTYISPASEKIFHYKPDEMVGTHFKNYLIKSEIPRVSQRFAENMRGENLGVFQMESMRKDGSHVFIELNSSPIVKDGETIGIQGVIRDITERKRAEETLQESESKYRTLVENLPQKIFLKDKNSVYVSCNDNLARDFKIKSEEIAGKTDYDIVPRELAEEYRADDKRIIESGQTKAIEEKYIQEGEERIIHIVKTPVKDEQGNIIGVLGIFWDITELKKAQDALETERRRLYSLLDNLPAFVYLQAPDHSVRFANRYFRERFGDPEEKRCYEVFWGATEPCKPCPTFRVFDTKEPQLWEWDQSPDDRIYEINDYPFSDVDGSPLVLELGIDITERKKAEEQIRKLISAVEQSIDGIAVGDLEPKLLYVNDAFARMHGYTPEEMVGIPVTKLHKKLQMQEHRRHIKQLKTKGFWEGEIGHIRKDGTAFLTYMSVTLLKNNEGKPTGTLAVARDITESKRTEEELNIYKEKMARAEELASVGTLSASLAHELTQPLTVIRLSIQNSLAELETMSCPGTVIEDLKEGLSEISSVTSIIDRFRNFARMSLKGIVDKVDLKVVAERIVKLSDESAWRAKVNLQVEGMDKLPLIYSYERDLEQLFFSLVENAIQAADGKKNRQVIISGAVRDENIELQFSDNCGGIAPENLDRIFEPFFTTKHTDKRTGLGLCVVERIVSQLGGKVHVESKLGKGSTFFITLPINRDGR